MTLRCGLAFLVALGLLIEFMWRVPGVALNEYAADYYFGVDQTWRLLLGQRLYHDFISPLGPLYYATLRWCWWVKSGAGQAVFGVPYVLVFTPIIFWLEKKWKWWAVALALFFAVRTVAPHFADRPWGEIAILSPYNQAAVLLLGVCLLAGLAGGWIGGMVVCITISLLFLLKANMAAIALIFILECGMFLFACGISGLLTSVLVWGLVDLSGFVNYVKTLIFVGQSTDWSNRVWVEIEWSISIPLFLQIVLGFMLLLPFDISQPRHKRSSRFWVIFLTLVTLSWIVALNDVEHTAILGVLSLWVGFKEFAERPAFHEDHLVKPWVGAIPLVLFFLIVGGGDLIGLIRWPILYQNTPSYAWTRPGMEHVRVWGEAKLYTQELERVATQLPKDGKIVNLSFANLFPFLTQTVPPRGLAWFDAGRTVSHDRAPTGAYLFGEGVWVVEWPHGWFDLTEKLLSDLYEPYLAQRCSLSFQEKNVRYRLYFCPKDPNL